MFNKFTWGHGIALALGSFIIFILYLVFIFPIGKQNSDLISENYYEDEILYQKVIDAKTNADKLSQRPTYKQDEKGIHIQFPTEIIPEDRQVKFHLFRTDDATLDVEKTISLDASNTLQIPPQIMTAGSYTLKVSWVKNKVPYQIDYELLWKIRSL